MILVAIFLYIVLICILLREFDKDRFIISFKINHNCMVWKYLVFCQHHYPMKCTKALHIAAKELAYWRNIKINDSICPISLKEFDKSFDQSILHCDKGSDKEWLNIYKNQHAIGYKPMFCPVLNYVINVHYEVRFCVI